MRSYFKRLDTRGHFGDFWHKAKTQREDKKICARMERRRLNMTDTNTIETSTAAELRELPCEYDRSTRATSSLSGHWEKCVDERWQRCSVCAVPVYVPYIYNCKASEDSNFNYCPHCGAKMDV